MKWLRELAAHADAGWVAALALALLQAYQWVDSHLYQRYRDRLSDAAEWNDAQAARMEKLEARLADLEDRAEVAEAHAARCEETLGRLVDRLDEESDIEWGIEDV